MQATYERFQANISSVKLSVPGARYDIMNRPLGAFDLRFWVDLAINLPTTLVLAWVFTKILDTPSVKLGKWVTRLIGLDAKKPTKASTEGSVVLPT